MRGRQGFGVKRTLFRLMVAAALAAVGVASLPLVAGAGEPAVKQLRTIPSVGPLYVDPGHRLMYQIHNNSSPAVIDVLSLDTLKIRRTVTFEAFKTSIAPTFRGAGLHMHGTLAAVDEAGARLFYPHRDTNGNLQIGILNGLTGATSNYALKAPPPLPPTTPTSTLGIEAIAYEPRGDLLYLLYMLPLAPSGTTHSSEGRIVVQEVSAADGQSRWARQLDGCTALPTDANSMPAFGRGRSAVYAVCSSGYSLDQVGFGVLGTDATLIFRIPVAPDGTSSAPKAYLTPGNSVRGMFDRKSERIFIMRPNVMAVFDGLHSVFVGLVPTGSRQIIGIDGAIGRVYLCTQVSSDHSIDGLAITDAAIAQQPPTAEDYSAVGCASTPSTWRIVADPKTHRIFLPEDDDVWAVVKDNVPPYTLAAISDPDAGVVDIPESPQTTDSTISAQGAAYGTRVVMVGGPMGTLDNLAFTAAQAIRQNSYQVGVTVGESAREVRFASIPFAKLGKDGLQAAAIAADRDDRFEGDLQTARNYQLSGANQSGRDLPAAHPLQPFTCTKTSCSIKNSSGSPEWPYKPSACAAFGGTTDKPESDPGATGSHASCNFSKLDLDVSADAPKQTVAGLVTIGESSAKVHVFRDAARGVVAHSESVAKNVSIAGQVFIASATASVDSFAAGHKGKASAASYTRTFRGVSVLSADKKTELFKCSTPDECDPAKVVAAINSAIGPRLQARLPQPDPELFEGTVKGTAASLRQDLWQRLEEKALYDKPSEDLTMAAFELQINANIRSASGMIVQLAGVTSSALYQIFRKPEPVPVPTFVPLPTLPAPTVVTTIAPGPAGPEKKPTIVSTIVTDRLRTGTKLLIGFAGNPLLVLASWMLLLSPGYVAIRRRFLLRRTGGNS